MSFLGESRYMNTFITEIIIQTSWSFCDDKLVCKIHGGGSHCIKGCPYMLSSEGFIPQIIVLSPHICCEL